MNSKQSNTILPDNSSDRQNQLVQHVNCFKVNSSINKNSKTDVKTTVT